MEFDCGHLVGLWIKLAQAIYISARRQLFSVSCTSSPWYENSNLSIDTFITLLFAAFSFGHQPDHIPPPNGLLPAVFHIRKRH